MSRVEFKYSFVLTSCGRFDLLRQTVESFLQFADILPTQFIIVEDSGDDKVQDALAGLNVPFEFVINRSRLGQEAAIDAGYARVNTPYVFHCEDDWEFFRTGFIAESFILLDALPQASAVMLRGRDEHRKLRRLPAEELDGVKFFRAHPKLDKFLFGYGYNPGLRRMKDYQRIMPLAGVGGEREVSFVFLCWGFASAHLEIPAVCHTGWGRHVQGIAYPNAKPFLQKRFSVIGVKPKSLDGEFLVYLKSGESFLLNESHQSRSAYYWRCWLYRWACRAGVVGARLAFWSVDSFRAQ